MATITRVQLGTLYAALQAEMNLFRSPRAVGFTYYRLTFDTMPERRY